MNFVRMMVVSEKIATTQVQEVCLSADTIIILIYQQGVQLTEIKFK